MTQTTKKPSVLFVCSKNGGKSQLAAGLMNQLANGTVTVHSAGTKPGKSLNPQSVDSLAELGIDITGEHPKPVTDEVLNAVDVVIVLGNEAKVEAPEGKRLEVWDTDEPSSAASKAWNACAWSGTTSRPGSRSCTRSSPGTDRAGSARSRLGSCCRGKGHENGAEPDTPLGGRPL